MVMSAHLRLSIHLVCAVAITTVAITTVTVSTLHADTPQLKEVVVTASRIETAADKVANSITVLSADDIQRGQYRNIAEALRSVPGVDMVQSGPAGGNVAAFLRGANSEHTLVLLDGIELNNPVTTNRAFNLANVTLENVERIEVLRGPQSTLYGSDALGGVINIITKRPENGVKASVSSEAGSYNSFTQVGNVAYGGESLRVSAGVTRQDTGGISAAGSKYDNREHDGYENTSLTGNATYTPSQEVDFSMVSRYSHAGSQLDNAGGLGGDDPNRRLRNDEFFLASSAKTHFLDDTLSQAVTISYAKHSFSDDNDPDYLHALDLLRSHYDGDLFKIDGNNVWKATDWVTLVMGAQTERERASSSFRSDGAFRPYEDVLGDTSSRTNGLYSEARFSWSDRATFDAGLRVDDHSIFGKATTYRIAPAVYLDSGTKLRGTIGNGFKAPSLVQLYSSFGNRQLDAEKSIGWDVGVDQQVCGDEVELSATFFRNNFDNLITFNPSTFVLENISQSYSQGFEFGGTWRPYEVAHFAATYTYTDTEDESTGAALLRRPQNKGSVTATLTPVTGVELYAKWTVFGGRFDNDFSAGDPARQRLGGYSLVDIGGSYSISERLQVFVRVDNLFDKEYENVLGYGTLGAAGYGGIRVHL